LDQVEALNTNTMISNLAISTPNWRGNRIAIASRFASSPISRQSSEKKTFGNSSQYGGINEGLIAGVIASMIQPVSLLMNIKRLMDFAIAEKLNNSHQSFNLYMSLMSIQNT
jgi:hypothetical protein